MTTLETLVYDDKAYKEYFAGFSKIIKWSKDFGYLDAAMDHIKTRNEHKAAVDSLR